MKESRIGSAGTSCRCWTSVLQTGWLWPNSL